MTPLLPPDLEEALAHCASEPVHIPGTIQPAGCLVCTDRAMTRVLQVSANTADFLGIDPQVLLQEPPAHRLPDLFPTDLVAAIEAAPDGMVVREIRADTEATGDLPFDSSATGPGVLQVTGWLSGDRLVLEIEPVPRLRQRRILARINHWLESLARAETREILLDTLVRGVAELTGFDRVMVYRFDADWNGEVIAESCVVGVEGFLGHRFPASDIPSQVRALYDCNPVRSIPDATAAAVPLLARDEPAALEPLDLSRGALRGVSPVHLEYLRNMGVGGSLSLAIHGSEQLWGLMTCHALAPLRLSPALRDAALTLVRMATQRLFLLEARDFGRYFQRVSESRLGLALRPSESVEPMELVSDHAEQWLGLFNACGLAFVYDGDMIHFGVTPTPEVLRRLVRRLTARHHDYDPWVSDAIAESSLGDVGDLEGCVGLMALPIATVSPPAWLLLFRLENRHSVRWAGEPEKQLVKRAGKYTLNPRHSFASWVETVTGRSQPWLDIEREAATGLVENLAIAVSVHQIGELNDRLTEANAELAALARTDSLTGAWNRYHMEEELDHEVAAAARYERPLVVLLFDVDHFKQFNDTYGHDAGDRVLKFLVKRVGACLRGADRLGRWGGEEFIVLATQTDAEAGLQLAERLRAEVASGSLEGLDPVTISVGVAECRPGDTRKSLVNRADEAMYRAKQAGRNRVEYLADGAGSGG